MAITDTRGIIPRDLAAPERQVNSRNASAPDPLTFMEPRTEAGIRAIRADALCLMLITLLTALPYVARLGFYSDDWYVLWTFHADSIQHHFGIPSALRDRYDRPLQGLYLALLYRLFGLHPL